MLTLIALLHGVTYIYMLQPRSMCVYTGNIKWICFFGRLDIKKEA